MRPVIVACAVVAGTAIQILLSRRVQSQQQSPEDTSTDNNDASAAPPSQPSTDTNPRHQPDAQPQPQTNEFPRAQTDRSPNPPTNSRTHFRPRAKTQRNPHVLHLLNSISPVIGGAAFVSKFGDDRDCSFCLDPITCRSPRLRATPCGHGFHAQCLEEWVLYTASAAFDWRNYSVSNDGLIDFTKSAPTCPNCTCRLPVLPAKIVHNAMMTAVARALSLPDLDLANHVFNVGIITPTDNVCYLTHPEVDPRSQTFAWARSRISANLEIENAQRENLQRQVSPQMEEQAYFSAQIESQMRPVSALVSVQHSSRSRYFLSTVNHQSIARHSGASDRTRVPNAVSSQETPFGGGGSQSSVAHVPPPSPRMLERNAGRRADGSTHSSQSRSTIMSEI